MDRNLEGLKQKVLEGGRIGKEDALWLAGQPLEGLCRAADEIRRKTASIAHSPLFTIQRWKAIPSLGRKNW